MRSHRLSRPPSPRTLAVLTLTLLIGLAAGFPAPAAARSPKPRADLTVSGLSLTPSQGPAGTKVTVTLTVKNAGPVAVSATSVAFQLGSTPDAPLSSTTALGTVAVPSVAARGSTKLAATVSVPAVSAGAYYLLAVVDASGSIPESNETNNRTATGLQVVASSPAGLTVWVVDSLTRVQPTDPPGAVTAAAIKAARNEYEAFQIVVRAPDGQALADVTVAASDLVGPGVIPSSRVVLYREHYIRVKASSPDSPYSAGWWPDALIPFVHPETGEPLGGRFPAAPFPVAAGQNQPIWVEVYVSEGTPPGSYRGRLTVAANGVPATTVPFALTVWNFTLPRVPSFQSYFGGFRRIAAQHSVAAGSPEYVDIARRYERSLMNHRLMPGFYEDGYPSVAADGSIDGSQATPVLQELVSRGLGSYGLPFYMNWPFPDPLGGDRASSVRYLRELMAYLDQFGLADKAYYYAVDEPASGADYELVRQAAAVAREADPRIRVLVTEQPWPQDPAWGSLDGRVDVWVPLFRYLDDTRVGDRVAAGETVWSYTALRQGAPGLPHWLLDLPVLNYRITSWLNASSALSGLLYWTTVYWDSVHDPWTDPATYTTQGLTFNGEGSLFYPGSAVNYAGPVESFRLKALRDGAEDYEYFALLDRAGRAADAAALLAQLVRSWTDWSHDPAALQMIRDQAATILDALGPS